MNEKHDQIHGITHNKHRLDRLQRTPAEWRQAIDSLTGNRALRQHVACIVWWEQFATSPVAPTDLDDYVNAPPVAVPDYPGDTAVVDALCRLGFSQRAARHRGRAPSDMVRWFKVNARRDLRREGRTNGGRQ
jgi:hypothetical protein